GRRNRSRLGGAQYLRGGGIGAPLAPAPGVQSRIVVADEVRGEQQAVGGDAGAAAGDERPSGIDARLGEQLLHLGDALERAVLAVEGAERQVAGARRMTGGDARARVRLGAFEAPFAARIDPWKVRAAEQLLLGGDLVVLGRFESRVARDWLAAFGRSLLGEPFLEPAVEDRDLARPEVTKHEPAPGGGPDRRIVISHDAVCPADPELLHRPAKLSRGRQHVRRRMRAVA